MTYRNHRNILHKQMMAYLRFMKHCDTDQQLLALNAEVNELRLQVQFFDQFTPSQLLETVKFSEGIVPSESFDFVPDGIGVSRDNHGFTGVYWDKSKAKYVGTLKYKGKRMVQAYCDSPQEAARQRDLAIIKFYLPHPLQVLTKK